MLLPETGWCDGRANVLCCLLRVNVSMWMFLLLCVSSVYTQNGFEQSEF